MLMRLMKVSRLSSEQKSSVTVSGLASRVISAVGAMDKEVDNTLKISDSIGTGRSEGVPPPKKMLVTGGRKRPRSLSQVIDSAISIVIFWTNRAKSSVSYLINE